MRNHKKIRRFVSLLLIAALVLTELPGIHKTVIFLKKYLHEKKICAIMTTVKTQ